MRLVLLGPPGAGKGVQAQLLTTEYSVPHVSTGSMFRELMGEETELAARIRSFLERGALVPDDLTVEVVEGRLARADCSNGYILDGFPRTVRQAEVFDASLARQGKEIDAVIYFDVPAATVVDRLSGRLVCSRCGVNYHVANIPPKRPGVCDSCGEKLVRRSDDEPETIRRRLEVYRQQTADLIDHYERRGVLRTVQANAGVEDVWADVKAILS